jgi:hypothetical protein
MTDVVIHLSRIILAGEKKGKRFKNGYMKLIIIFDIKKNFMK